MTEPTVFGLVTGVGLVVAVTLGAVIGRCSRDREVEVLVVKADRTEKAGIETARLLMAERAEHSDKILFFKARVRELSIQNAELLERCGETTEID